MGGGSPTTRARWLAAAVAAVAYAAGSYTLMTRAQDSAWSLLVVLGPLAILGTAAAWGNGRRLLAGAGLLAAVLLAVFAASGRGLPARWLYLAQHAGVHLVLGAWFGSTLRKGADPLVSTLARRVHGSLTQGMARYTRQVTLAWTLYFVGMATASLALFAAGDFAHWSLLADVLTPVLTGAFFVGEYLVRYWLHPEFERVGLHQAILAWRAHGAGGTRTDTRFP